MLLTNQAFRYVFIYLKMLNNQHYEKADSYCYVIILLIFACSKDNTVQEFERTLVESEGH